MQNISLSVISQSHHTPTFSAFSAFTSQFMFQPPGRTSLWKSPRPARGLVTEGIDWSLTKSIWKLVKSWRVLWRSMFVCSYVEIKRATTVYTLSQRENTEASWTDARGQMQNKSRQRFFYVWAVVDCTVWRHFHDDIFWDRIFRRSRLGKLLPMPTLLKPYSKIYKW